MKKIWQLSNPIPADFKNQFPEINPIILQLLYDRGLNSQAEIDEFLNPDYGQDLHDPFLFLDMDKAVDRIYQAINNKEKILIYGDYDADGVCSSVLLISLLKTLGVNPGIYIPDREHEGYGINLDAANEFIRNKVQLIITVDCGIANFKEIEFLTQNNVDVIVTDHHEQIEKLPNALVVLDPKIANQTYPFKELSGCGVAYKLTQAVLSEKSREKYKTKTPSQKLNQSKIINLKSEITSVPIGYEKWFLDLVAVATIADMCPLLGENRTLVKYGLVVLEKTRRQGFIALSQISRTPLTKINTHQIGFQISPRLNAAGRIDHASTAFELLITDQLEYALNIAKELDLKNQERQKITENILTEAKNQIGEVTNQKILFAVGLNWPIGIIGLVAGKLTDEFFRPSIVLSKNNNNELIGSGRSIPALNITKTLKECSNLLTRFGGHSQACGLTLKQDNLEKFIQKFSEIVEIKLQNEDLRPILKIDQKILLKDVNWDLVALLNKFEPFGQKNEKPLFLAKNLEVKNLQPVGKDGKHLRIMVADENNIIRKTIGFCFGDWCQKIKAGDKIDLIFEVDINTWNGNQELQLKIADLKKSN